jgi:small-conductance mechanosensitive channel
VWIDYDSQLKFVKARSEMIKAIKSAFDKNDILIPFPIRTLDFDIKGGENLVTPLKKAFASLGEKESQQLN